MPESVQVQIYGAASQPALIYLPGLHGDWTIIGGFRRAVGDRVRFVEVTYPRTLTWSLADYAAGIAEALRANGIAGGWLLGESFGSQVAWEMAAGEGFSIEGIILAGGFVRHPSRVAVKLAERFAGGIPLNWLVRVLFGYARIKQLRYRHCPEAVKAIQEFLARRTEEDRQAAKHRLHLISNSDACEIARHVRVPVYALSGSIDPVVPWFPVRRWLRRNCPALRDFKIIWPAEHNVLSSAPNPAARQILEWIAPTPSGTST
jgi:pimeloyl-ACP methyl ester carboxylesterase